MLPGCSEIVAVILHTCDCFNPCTESSVAHTHKRELFKKIKRYKPQSSPQTWAEISTEKWIEPGLTDQC